MSAVTARSAGQAPVTHDIPPVWDERSRVLLLGTMPSPKSRAFGFYYGHPQNRFWPLLAALFAVRVPMTLEERRDFALERRIALWDVLASCSISGASDSTIRNPVPNDLSAILDHAPVRFVFAVGKTAGALYGRLLRNTTGIEAITLPSPSPANRGRYPMERLLEAWRPVAEALR